MEPTGGMSKKTFSAGMAITAIAASSDPHTQITIAVVGIVALVIQGWLDYKPTHNEPD